LLARARELLGQADPAVRSVAADLLARRPDVADVDRLVTAYQRAAGDPFDDARLSAVAALGAVARAGAEGRLRVAARFVAAVPRPDDYLVRRVAADRLPDAAEAWGPVVPIATGKTDADYRDAVRRVLLPALEGRAAASSSSPTPPSRTSTAPTPSSVASWPASTCSRASPRAIASAASTADAAVGLERAAPPRGPPRGGAGPVRLLRAEQDPVPQLRLARAAR